MKNIFISKIQASIALKEALLEDAALLATLEQMVGLGVQCFRSGGKLLFCGNGGSAADAQHLAAELSGRFYKNRAPLYAEALHVNTSYLTAVANDYGYEESFARMVRAAGRSGDVLVAMSTSGNSPNILKAAEAARSLGMQVVAFTGRSGGKLAAKADLLLAVPSEDTPRIQECHILLGHIWCEMLEELLFPSGEADLT
jgi:D-sedoheptulose 7-phosphate isomerase